MPNSALLQMLANPRETGADEKYRAGVLSGYLQNNGEAALGGDPAVLGKVAGYDPKLAVGLQDNAREQKKFGMVEAEAKLDKMLGVVQWADNPAKWGQAVNMLKAQGFQFDPGEDLFENRDATLAKGIGLKKQLAMQKGAGEFGLNPIYVKDAQGRVHALQPNKAGGPPNQIEVPEGMTIAPGMQFLNTGTSFVGVDKRTGIPGMSQPIDVAGKANQAAAGKGQAERALERPQAELTLNNTVNSLGRLKQYATAIRNDPNLGRITGWMSLVPNAPGGGAANVQAKLNTLKSQIGFSVLQAMRDASKTGGALGNVSNQEGIRLENNLAALEQAQSAEEFQNALDQIIQYADTTGGLLQRAFQQTYGGQDGQPQETAPQPSQGFQEGDYFDGEADVPEGATVVDDNGQAFRKQNGQMIPVQ